MSSCVSHWHVRTTCGDRSGYNTVLIASDLRDEICHHIRIFGLIQCQCETHPKLPSKLVKLNVGGGCLRLLPGPRRPASRRGVADKLVSRLASHAPQRAGMMSKMHASALEVSVFDILASASLSESTKHRGISCRVVTVATEFMRARRKTFSGW